MYYHQNIAKETQANTFFRKVLYTGAKSQLVVMEIKPGESIGQEVHENVEQILFFAKGSGKAVLDGKEVLIAAGDVFVIGPGTRHDFFNTGSGSLKIYTIYCPPNHLDGRVHKTKAEAEADQEDEDFGHQVQ